MSTQTETHRFTNLPLRLSGNVVATRLNGEVEWRLRETTQAGWAIDHIFHLSLNTEDGGLVEVLPDEPMWDVVIRALRERVKLFSTSKPRGEDATEFSTNETNVVPNLDNAQAEGAQKASG